MLTTILTQENKPEDRHAVSITGFSSLSTNIRLVLFPSVSTRLSLTYASANMRCNYGKDENRDDRSLEIDYCFGCDHISMSNSQFDSVASVILGHFSFAVSIHARASCDVDWVCFGVGRRSQSTRARELRLAHRNVLLTKHCLYNYVFFHLFVYIYYSFHSSRSLLPLEEICPLE